MTPVYQPTAVYWQQALTAHATWGRTLRQRPGQALAAVRPRAAPAKHVAAAAGKHARNGRADARRHARDHHYAVGVDDDPEAGAGLVVILRALPARQQPVLLLLRTCGGARAPCRKRNTAVATCTCLSDRLALQSCASGSRMLSKPAVKLFRNEDLGGSKVVHRPCLGEAALLADAVWFKERGLTRVKQGVAAQQRVRAICHCTEPCAKGGALFCPPLQSPRSSAYLHARASALSFIVAVQVVYNFRINHTRCALVY